MLIKTKNYGTMMHKNSQKRLYMQNGIYFITTNTYENFPFFHEEILCELLVHEIKLCQKLKSFHLFAYKINPGHIHLLIQPFGEHHYSEIMQFIKRHFSRDIKYVVGDDGDGIPDGSDIGDAACTESPASGTGFITNSKMKS